MQALFYTHLGRAGIFRSLQCWRYNWQNMSPVFLDALLPAITQTQELHQQSAFSARGSMPKSRRQKVFLRLNHRQYIESRGLKSGRGDVWYAVYDLQQPPEDLGTIYRPFCRICRRRTGYSFMSTVKSDRTTGGKDPPRVAQKRSQGARR